MRYIATAPRTAWAGKIELFDKYIDYSDRIILSHIIVQELGQQRALSAVFALNKALHLAPERVQRKCDP